MVILIGSSGGIYMVIGLIAMVLLEAWLKNKSKRGELFKDVGKFKDNQGNNHEFDYYYDEEKDEYIKL